MRLNIIGSILIYILFAQVSPYVHWHAHEHQGEIDLRVSIHPPEIITDIHKHDDHHDQAQEHEHDDFHFIVDSDYINQVKTLTSFFTDHPFIIIDYLVDENQVLDRKPQDIPLKLLWHYLPSIVSYRAPPHIS